MVDTLGSPCILAADSENFQPRVLENSHQGPVLVNFWSRKAGPCLRRSPLLVNVDADIEVAVTRDYGVNSVPTLKLFRRRGAGDRHGYQSEADLHKLLEHHVARDSDLDPGRRRRAVRRRGTAGRL